MISLPEVIIGKIWRFLTVGDVNNCCRICKYIWIDFSKRFRYDKFLIESFKLLSTVPYVHEVAPAFDHYTRGQLICLHAFTYNNVIKEIFKSKGQKIETWRTTPGGLVTSRIRQDPMMWFCELAVRLMIQYTGIKILFVAKGGNGFVSECRNIRHYVQAFFDLLGYKYDFDQTFDDSIVFSAFTRTYTGRYRTMSSFKIFTCYGGGYDKSWVNQDADVVFYFLRDGRQEITNVLGRRKNTIIIRHHYINSDNVLQNKSRLVWQEIHAKKTKQFILYNILQPNPPE